ncbi:hypothetical protein KLEP7_gp99 [Pseudaeromonas phage vB_PpeM_ KLEP7]|nr:hypothetical protein KLEP7_gp99 [Pseudaeromonas phage vB_PpeM_ KLEP7]
MENNKEELRQRLRNIILYTCNKVGCKNCDLIGIKINYFSGLRHKLGQQIEMKFKC